MNKLLILFLFLSSGFSSAICKSGLNNSLSDSISYNDKAVQQNYIIAKYVIGSGGIIGASSPNYLHLATAGETFVGFMQGTNNLLISGFWQPGLHFTDLDQKESVNIPKAFALYQNYPNPFNPNTTIQYELACQCLVVVEIFNVLSQRIQQLSNQIQSPGRLHVFWNGHDDQGKVMDSGIYFYRITAFEIGADIIFQQTKKMLLIK